MHVSWEAVTAFASLLSSVAVLAAISPIMWENFEHLYTRGKLWLTAKTGSPEYGGPVGPATGTKS